jgi:pentatricopeptide repeat protein
MLLLNSCTVALQSDRRPTPPRLLSSRSSAAITLVHPLRTNGTVRYPVSLQTKNNNNNNDSHSRRKQQSVWKNRHPKHEETTDADDKYEQTYQINLQLANLAQRVSKSRSSSLVQSALRLFRQLESPDTVSYNTILQVLSNVSPYGVVVEEQNGEQPAYILADSIFQEMKTRHARQVRENAAWYERLHSTTPRRIRKSKDPMMTVVHDHPHDNDEINDAILSNSMNLDNNEDNFPNEPPRIRVKPNVRTYATVIRAWAQAGKVSQCQKLLQELEHQYIQSQNDFALKPNHFVYNACLSACAKAGAANEAMQLLKSMPIPADIVSYNTVLDAIAKSGWVDAGVRAESFLRNQIVKPGIVPPNARSYTIVMDAYAKTRQPDRARQILQSLWKFYEETTTPRKEQLRPTTVTYSTVISAYAAAASTSTTPQTEEMEAYEIFQEMVHRNIPLNPVVFNNLLNCCSNSLDRIRQIYQTMVSMSFTPNCVTYGTILKACATNLLTDNARTLAISIFQDACDNGQVSSGVLYQLRLAIPLVQYRDLVGQETTDTHTLPSSWIANVREERNDRRNHRKYTG